MIPKIQTSPPLTWPNPRGKLCGPAVRQKANYWPKDWPYPTPTSNPYPRDNSPGPKRPICPLLVWDRLFSGAKEVGETDSLTPTFLPPSLNVPAKTRSQVVIPKIQTSPHLTWPNPRGKLCSSAVRQKANHWPKDWHYPTPTSRDNWQMIFLTMIPLSISFSSVV